MPNHSPNAGGPEFERLMALPINDPERPKLSDRIALSGPKLAARARKFCSLSREFGPNPTPIDKRPLPTYQEWLNRVCAYHRPTVGPWFIPGPTNDAAQYVRTFNTLHNLKP